jgi:hypothetical protein
MGKREDLLRIKDNILKNRGEWDLTDDNGEPVVYDDNMGIPIPDLAINKDDTPCALVPLGYFDEDTLCKILATM